MGLEFKRGKEEDAVGLTVNRRTDTLLRALVIYALGVEHSRSGGSRRAGSLDGNVGVFGINNGNYKLVHYLFLLFL